MLIADFKKGESRMNDFDKYQKAISVLKERFGGKINLTKKETAAAIGISHSSFNRLIAENDFANLPKFARYGGSKSKYVFPITSVASFLADRS